MSSKELQELSRLIDEILASEQYIRSQVHRLKRGTRERKKRDADLRYTRWLKKKKILEYRQDKKDPRIEP